MIHPVLLALQILVLEEVRIIWILIQKQSELILIIFTRLISNLFLLEQHHIHPMLKMSFDVLAAGGAEERDYKTILASGSLALSSCVALRYN